MKSAVIPIFLPFFHNFKYNPGAQLKAILEQQALCHGLIFTNSVRVPRKQLLLLIRHGNLIRFKSTDCWMESQDLHRKSSTSRCQYDPEQSAKCSAAPDSVMGLRSASALRRRRELHPHLRTQLPPVFSLTAYSVFA